MGFERVAGVRSVFSVDSMFFLCPLFLFVVLERDVNEGKLRENAKSTIPTTSKDCFPVWLTMTNEVITTRLGDFWIDVFVEACFALE